MSQREKQVNIARADTIHMVGIGGIGMSALARLFLYEKKKVSGSDRETTSITCTLEALGIKIATGQESQSIDDGIDLVVYTEAIPKEHPELVAARKKKISTMSYFEALGLMVNPYYLIAVAGTHGKTTTTAMLTDIFEHAGKDPTAIIGSLRSKTQSNFRAGKSKYAIVEACEYKRDFLSLEPDILVITNIEPEHLDYYTDLADIQKAFRELAERVPEDGAVIANLGEENVKPVVEGLSCEVIDYSKYVDPLLRLKQPGLHNQMNAAAAMAIAHHESVGKDAVKAALEEFSGTWRRFEYKGKTKNDTLIYDDYAHHPTEIRATLKALRELYPDKKVTVVFHPHLYSRTNIFFTDFAESFAEADEVLVVPIYAAREAGDGTVSNSTLAEAIAKNGISAHAPGSFDAAIKYIKNHADVNSIIMTMGAGDVYKIADALTT